MLHPEFRKNAPPQSGASHWWMQRLSSILIAPLSLWFCWALLMLEERSQATLIQWMQSPWTAVLLLAFLAVTCYHAVLGLRVVAEDYIHTDWLRAAVIALIYILFPLLTVLGVLAVLSVFLQA